MNTAIQENHVDKPMNQKSILALANQRRGADVHDHRLRTSNKPTAKVQRMESRLVQCGFKTIPATTPTANAGSSRPCCRANSPACCATATAITCIRMPLSRCCMWARMPSSSLPRLVSNLQENKQYDEMSKIDPAWPHIITKPRSSAAMNSRLAGRGLGVMGVQLTASPKTDR